MNGADLSQVLRSLRQRPPAGAFESRLHEALLAAAAERRLRPLPKHSDVRRRASRWGGRLSVSLAVTLAASAAAASAGWYALSLHAGPADPVAPAALPKEVVSSQASVAKPRPKGASGAEPPAAVEQAPPEAPPEVQLPIPAESLPSPAERARPALPRARAIPKLRSEAGSESKHISAPRPAPAADLPELLPFELPHNQPTPVDAASRSSAERAAEGRRDARDMPSAASAGSNASGQRRRKLPDVPPRERSARRDHARHDRGALAVPRSNAPEQRGRENGERGLRRAREVRERNRR